MSKVSLKKWKKPLYQKIMDSKQYPVFVHWNSDLLSFVQYSAGRGLSPSGCRYLAGLFRDEYFAQHFTPFHGVDWITPAGRLKSK